MIEMLEHILVRFVGRVGYRFYLLLKGLIELGETVGTYIVHFNLFFRLCFLDLVGRRNLNDGIHETIIVVIKMEVFLCIDQMFRKIGIEAI